MDHGEGRAQARCRARGYARGVLGRIAFGTFGRDVRRFPWPACQGVDVSQYQELDGRRVAATLERLKARIDARFDTQRGLGAVAAELSALVTRVDEETDQSQARIRVTRRGARALSALIGIASLVAFALAVKDAAHSGPRRTLDWLPLIESAINDIVFAGIAVIFLLALPERLERRHLLSLLHRLRSLAHVIDMHQLSKDPEQLLPSYQPTSASEPVGLDAEELRHYFDYCSELLSLVAKTSALCAESLSDPVVLNTVSTIESLTTDMSVKIWQKSSLVPR